MTIEFFWRPFEKFAPWPCVLGLSGSENSACDIYRGNNVDGKGAWMFYYNGTWDIDEVRITGKVLKPEQFCRRYPKALHVILR